MSLILPPHVAETLFVVADYLCGLDPDAPNPTHVLKAQFEVEGDGAS
jgi:hypothetical protein